MGASDLWDENDTGSSGNDRTSKRTRGDHGEDTKSANALIGKLVLIVICLLVLVIVMNLLSKGQLYANSVLSDFMGRIFQKL